MNNRRTFNVGRLGRICFTRMVNSRRGALPAALTTANIPSLQIRVEHCACELEIQSICHYDQSDVSGDGELVGALQRHLAIDASVGTVCAKCRVPFIDM